MHRLGVLQLRQYWFQLDVLAELPEGVDALLQTFGDGKIARLEDVPAVLVSGGLLGNEEVVQLSDTKSLGV